MKKLTIVAIVVGAMFGVAIAKEWATFNVTSTGSAASEVIKAVKGKSAVCMSYNSSAAGAAGTCTIYTGTMLTELQAAASAATTVTVNSASSGQISGILPTTSDKVVCNNIYSAISTVTTNGAVTNGYITLILGTAITGSAGDTVYICDDGEKVTVPIATSATIGLPYMFATDAGMPAVVSYPASTTGTVSGLVRYMK